MVKIALQMSKREALRNKLANNICREVRFQLSSHSNQDLNTLMKHLLKWMKVAKKDKYVRPKI